MTATAPARATRAGLAEVVAVTAEHAADVDREARFPTEALAALRSAGLLGLMVPAADGGRGGTLLDLVEVTEELGRADVSVAMIFAMHCQQVLAVVRHAGPRLRTAVLPALGRGELYLASVTTERGKGGDLLTSGSEVSAAGGLLRLDRDAPIVTGGVHADAFLVTTLMPGATAPSQVSLLYAGRDQVRAEVSGQWRALGMRATQSLPMRLTGTVPDWQVVGEPGGFRAVVADCFGPLAHVGWAAAWLGGAAGALSRVLHHLRGPGRAGIDPGSPLLLTRLARVRARLDGVNALLRHTVDVLDRTEDLAVPPVQLLVNALKVVAAEQCHAAADDLVELLGLRHGYLQDSPLFLERTLRDLRSASLNYANDRLLLANGALTLLDREVHLG